MQNEFEEEEAEARPRTALSEEIAQELSQRTLDPSDCIRLTLVPHQGLDRARESIRPVEIAGKCFWQRERRQGKQSFVRNCAAGAEATSAVEEMLSATGAREYHLAASKGDLHVRITRKGRELVSRGKPQAGGAPAEPAPHDRSKDQPLSRFDSSVLLRVIGIAGGDGAIRASMRGKYDQINAFLRETDAVLDDAKPDGSKTFSILDCGCGRAYLTLSALFYLRETRGLDVKIKGIDRNADVIERCNSMAADLGVAAEAEFAAEDLADFSSDSPVDMLLSLHACDIATDLAIAAGIRSSASSMLVAPCFQHDIQTQLKDTGHSGALLRHSILRERFADLLTDAFRAQILRICGYRTKVLEFVSPDATARNIMLRASKGLKPGQREPIGEYLALKDEWKVVPALESILGDKLDRLLRLA